MEHFFHTLSAIELKECIMRGECTAVAVTLHFLNRIKVYDKAIGAFLTVFYERALEKARLIDKKRASGALLGRLAGIPVALKDNMHVKGAHTTCASKFLCNYKALFDATVVRLLEAEDAIILGKTNLDEFAMGSSTEYSALQKTCNPWDLESSPGGSSGGSAAAVAARLCLAALGSDTGGSIRQPASFCGVVGYKPTYGRVSRYGLVSLVSSMDQIGPITSNVRDTALLMEVLGKHCPHDMMSAKSDSEEYLSEMNSAIENIRVGVPWKYLKMLQSPVMQLFERGLEDLKKLGAQIVDIELPFLEHSVETYCILGTAEAAINLARFDGIKYGRRSPQAQTVEEIYAFSKEEGFGAEVKRRILLGTYILSTGASKGYYQKAQCVRTLISTGFEQAFKCCDIIATPVTHSTAFKIGSIKDPLRMYFEDMYIIPMNLAGLPAISIPAGFIDGKPLGIHFTAPQKHDRYLLNVAYAFEKVTHHQQIPEGYLL